MGILKEYRGQGLGRALLEKTLTAAREQKLERVELEVYASNFVAVRLYKRHGFQIEGRKQKARKLDGSYDDIMVMALLFDS
jgi:ribosomal protein S18 acetylase RimI-like enzyme